MEIEGIYLIAGHNAKAQGAMGFDGIMEHERTTSLQNNIAEKLKVYDVEIMQDNETDTLAQIVERANKLPKGWVILDLHFNNNNPKATGCEVFVDKRTSLENRMIAGRMVRNLEKRTLYGIRRAENFRDYKYTSESHIGSLYIIEKTIHPAILIEPCFLNKLDLATYNEDVVSECIISAYNLKLK